MTEAEFAAAVERNMGRFVRIVAKYLRLQAADAEDVVQSALLKAWQHYPNCRGKLEKWIIVCVINEGLMLKRGAKRYRKRLENAGRVKAIRPSQF